MTRKIKVGDWVLCQDGMIGQVSHVGEGEDLGRCGVGGVWMSIQFLTVLPASPAVLARSHRLLMRFWKTRHSGAKQFDIERFIYAHCRRIAKGEK